MAKKKRSGSYTKHKCVLLSESPSRKMKSDRVKVGDNASDNSGPSEDSPVTKELGENTGAVHPGTAPA